MFSVVYEDRFQVYSELSQHVFVYFTQCQFKTAGEAETFLIHINFVNIISNRPIIRVKIYTNPL